MTEKFDRALHLRQIPVFALRMQLLSFLHEEEAKKLLISCMKQALKKKAIRTPKKAIEKLNRDDLVQIIQKYPQIDDAKIKELFEEYRYGTNPSFFIYRFNPQPKGRKKINKIQLALKKSVRAYNLTVPKEMPRVQNLVVDDLLMFTYEPEDRDNSEIKNQLAAGKESKVKKVTEVIEGTYRFQKRVDLIDEKENPISIYATVYGFFWINNDEGYVVIQAHERSILHALEDAISTGAGLHMVNLIITKELKNALPFLLSEALCSSKLHDPNPKSRRFQKISFTDEHLYDKGYNRWEKRYPEVSSSRYKINIKGIKDRRILSIGFEYGEMSIAGKLTASQFRDWALNRLSEIIRTIRDFETQPAKYIKTIKFRAMQELNKYQAPQREVIIIILALLLGLKKKPGIGARVLERPPLEIARVLSNLVHVQFKVACQDENCSMDGYLTCPTCKGKFFRVSEKDGIWSLTCANAQKDGWSAPLPIDTLCEQEHPFTISARDLQDWIEILPGRELLDVMSDIIKNYIPDSSFNGDIEYFMIHRQFMVYYAGLDDLSSLEHGTATIIYNIQTGDVIDSTITAGEGNQVIVVKETQTVHPKKEKLKHKEQTSLPIPT